MSREISFFSKSNSSITDSNLHVCCRLKLRPRPRVPRGFLICQGVMGRWNLLVQMSSGSGCESGLPKRTSMTSLSKTMGSSSSGSLLQGCRQSVACVFHKLLHRFGNSDVTISIPSASLLVADLTCGAIALMQAVAHVHPYCLVSSSFRFFTQDAHARSTPSLGSFRLCMKTGSPATSRAVASIVDCGMLSTSLVGQRRLRTHGAAAIRIASLRRIVSGVPERSYLTEVGVVVQKLVDRANIQHVPTHRLSSANAKSINSLTSASVVGASRLHAFSNAIKNKAPYLLMTKILPWRFQIGHHRQEAPRLTQVLKVGT